MITHPSEELVRALIDQTTEKVICWLFTIAHAESGEVYFKTNNTETLVSNGQAFDYLPVDFELPSDDGETISEIKITFKTAPKELIDLVRRYAGGITIDAQLVIADNPDNIEFEIEDLEIKQVHYDKAQIELTAQPEQLIDMRFPADDYLPGTFMGMFK